VIFSLRPCYSPSLAYFYSLLMPIKPRGIHWDFWTQHDFWDLSTKSSELLMLQELALGMSQMSSRHQSALLTPYVPWPVCDVPLGNLLCPILNWPLVLFLGLGYAPLHLSTSFSASPCLEGGSKCPKDYNPPHHEAGTSKEMIDCVWNCSLGTEGWGSGDKNQWRTTMAQ
jgi:hypothetical protein